MHPAQVEQVMDLARRLRAMPHGERQAAIGEGAALLGISERTLYRRLARAGYEPERKRRRDRGTTCVDRELALTLGGVLMSTTRANGKHTLPLTEVRGILRDNGLGVIDYQTGEITMPSTTTLSRAMRLYGAHPTQVDTGPPAQSLRSLHPNHVWEMDASVCVLFYLPKGRVQIMDEKVFNKNKPLNLARADQARVIRWVVTDHYSGSIYPRYTLGSETAAAAIDVLISAMAKREAGDGPLMHGAPGILYTDKGAPFIAQLTTSWLGRLGCKCIQHARGNARATGQAESAQNIVETHFEGRLRMMEVVDLATLNAQAAQWAAAFNAERRHRRHGMSRNSAWLLITAEQLRVPQSAEVLRSLVAHPSREVKVPGNLRLEYTPKGHQRQMYSLYDIPGIMPGSAVEVAVNPFTAPAIDVMVTAADGEVRTWTLEPMQRDRVGFALDAPVIGEEFHRHKDTATDRAIKDMRKAAYGVETLVEAAKAEQSRRRAYRDINAMADVEATSLPTYIPRRGQEIEAAGAQRQVPPLSPVQAAMQIREMLARHRIEWTAEHMRRLSEGWPQGVPAAEVEQIAAAIEAEARRPDLRLAAGG